MALVCFCLTHFLFDIFVCSEDNFGMQKQFCYSIIVYTTLAKDYWIISFTNNTRQNVTLFIHLACN